MEDELLCFFGSRVSLSVGREDSSLLLCISLPLMRLFTCFPLLQLMFCLSLSLTRKASRSHPPLALLPASGLPRRPPLFAGCACGCVRARACDGYRASGGHVSAPAHTGRRVHMWEKEKQGCECVCEGNARNNPSSASHHKAGCASQPLAGCGCCTAHPEERRTRDPVISISHPPSSLSLPHSLSRPSSPAP